MPTTRADVIAVLAACEPQELRLVLQAVDRAAPPQAPPRELAERIVRTLWWAYCTPAGFVIDRQNLDDLVSAAARRLKVPEALGDDDAWVRLDRLTRALATRVGPVRFDDLPPDTQARARGSMFPSLAFAGGSLSSYGAGAGARAFLGFAKGPIGRWIPYVPQVGPWFVAIRKASGVAAVVGTPLSIALGALALNQALSTRWRDVLPLLLSIGALQAHGRVSTVVEVPEP